MEKVNIAELLKDCPQGMELDCTMYEGLEFDGIADNEYFPIRCRIKNPKGGYTVYNFTKYGCWNDTDCAKCVIFPKCKTTWEGFVPPCEFKDGDIVSATIYPGSTWIGIFKQYYGEKTFESHCCLNTICEFRNIGYKNHSLKGTHLATEEEKQKLFDVIKANGYKWNTETKTLDKLIKPKFKVGDDIREKNKHEVFLVSEVCDNHYHLDEKDISLPFHKQDDWEIVPSKFDISTLKPFDKVLVRDSKGAEWIGGILSHVNYGDIFPFKFTDCAYKYCIPYNDDTKQLVGKTEDCDEFYKTWE